MRVLLVNDDGPPSAHSPHILGLYEELRRQNPTWTISVVLPSSQKSWGSMAFTLSPACSAWYYYPKRGNYDGSHVQTAASWSATRRPIAKDEAGEWILVDGSPTTCANIGLFSYSSLIPDADHVGDPRTPAFDLVVSGPNFGRNSGTAFSLCSGTIGAALSASLSGVRAISLSYAHFFQANSHVRAAEERRVQAGDSSKVWGQLPESATERVVGRAHELCAKLIKKLSDEWENDVGVYTVNVPLSWHLIDDGTGQGGIDQGPRVYWTRTWDSKFGPLFALQEEGQKQSEEVGGSSNSSKKHQPNEVPTPSLALRFAPDMSSMLQPTRSDDRSTETDIWAILHGHISVARLSPSYTTVTPARQATNVDSNRAPGSHFKL